MADDDVSYSLWPASSHGVDSGDGAFEVLEEGFVDEHDRVDVAKQGGRIVRRDDGHRRITRKQSERIRICLRGEQERKVRVVRGRQGRARGQGRERTSLRARSRRTYVRSVDSSSSSRGCSFFGFGFEICYRHERGRVSGLSGRPCGLVSSDGVGRTAAVSPSTLSLRLILPGVDVDEDDADDSGG